MPDPVNPAPPSVPTRLLRRAASWPLVLLATFVVLLDDAFRSWVKPAVARLAQLALMRRLESWISSLPPYGIVTLFVLPLLVIEPMKFVGLYFIGGGHWISGILTFVAAKVLGVGLAERLFAIGRDKLLSIGWFRWLFERAVGVKDSVHEWLRTKPFWKRAQAWMGRVKAALVRLKARIAAWRRRPASGRWAAARRLAVRIQGGTEMPGIERAAEPVRRGDGLVP